MAGFPSAPQFSGRTPVQFISDDHPSWSITGSNSLFNNPRVFAVNAGNMLKPAPALDGTSKFTGLVEYAPFQLDIEWAQLGFNDYLALSKLVGLPVTFISFRNVGYYGYFTLDGPQTPQPMTADVVKCTVHFFVKGPSDDGGAASVNRIATPTTLGISGDDTGYGFIQKNTNNHYFLTFHTRWGETDYQHVNLQETTGDNAWANIVTWSWPSGSQVTYASLYCCNANTPSSALLMAEVVSSLNPSWTDLVGFAGISPPGVALYQRPPTVNNAYSGVFKGGIWVNI